MSYNYYYVTDDTGICFLYKLSPWCISVNDVIDIKIVLRLVFMVVLNRKRNMTNYSKSKNLLYGSHANRGVKIQCIQVRYNISHKGWYTCGKHIGTLRVFSMNLHAPAHPTPCFHG